MKPRVAFFDFTGCEGCQLEVLNFNLEIVDLITAVDIVEFREASSDHSDNYDIAFIEGSITTEKDIARIQDIRSKAKILIALGACACTGGVNSLKNYYTMEENLRQEIRAVPQSRLRGMQAGREHLRFRARRVLPGPGDPRRL